MNRSCVASGIMVAALALAFAGSARPPQQTPAHFTYGGNAAEVPAEFIGSLVFLPIRVNESQPSFFELDSTARSSSINPKRAEELGIAGLRDPVLTLPGVQIAIPSLAVVTGERFGSQVGRAYEGSLGNDFLSAAVVEIDYARQTVRLYDPSAYKYAGSGATMPLSFAEGLPVVRAKFSVGGEKSHEADFVLNTSQDAGVVLSDRYAEAHGVFRAHAKTVSVSDPEIDDGEPVVLGRLRSFQMSREVAGGAIAAFSRKNVTLMGNSNLAGSIGGGMLRRFTVVLDYPHHQLILAPNSQFANQEEEDKSGLSLIAKGPGLKTIEVSQVRPGTPAADAGIQTGDIIAGIDDEPAADLSLADVRQMFRQIGHKHKLSLERREKTIEVTIQMRRLL